MSVEIFVLLLLCMLKQIIIESLKNLRARDEFSKKNYFFLNVLIFLLKMYWLFTNHLNTLFQKLNFKNFNILKKENFLPFFQQVSITHFVLKAHTQPNK